LNDSLESFNLSRSESQFKKEIDDTIQKVLKEIDFETLKKIGLMDDK